MVTSCVQRAAEAVGKYMKLPSQLGTGANLQTFLDRLDELKALRDLARG
jgi:hypothetical protein